MGKDGRHTIWYTTSKNYLKYRTHSKTTHEMTKIVLRTWDALYRKERWKYNFSLISLAGTNFFTPGNGSQMGK